MAKEYPSLTPELRDFIARQHIFFAASAATGTRINISPRSTREFRVTGDNEICWLDLTGSGAETAAHLKADGRLTIMFCAFEGAANILRLYGQGEAVDFDHQDYERMLALFPGYDSARAIIRVKLSRVQDSCGWGVPFYDFRSDRDQLKRWADSKDKGEQGRQAWRDKNAASIDGLPGLKGARRS